MGRNQFDAVVAEFRVELVGVIRVVSNQILRSFWNDHFDQGGKGQSDFVWSSTLDVYGYRQAVAVRNGHDLRAFAAFCLVNFRPRFLAGAKLPSIRAPRTSSAPLA